MYTFGSDAPKKIGDFGISDVGALVWLSGCIASASPELLIPMNALRIRGLHNAMNAMAATALTLAVGIPLDSILRMLREYKGEPHRVQLILRASDIDYVDDSKGTNVGAVAAALAGFGPKKVVLILGGDGKGQDFAPLKAPIETHAKGAVFIGRDAPLIEKEVDYPGLLKAHAKPWQKRLEKPVRWLSPVTRFCFLRLAQAGICLRITPIVLRSLSLLRKKSLKRKAAVLIRRRKKEDADDIVTRVGDYNNAAALNYEPRDIGPVPPDYGVLFVVFSLMLLAV